MSKFTLGLSVSLAALLVASCDPQSADETTIAEETPAVETTTETAIADIGAEDLLNAASNPAEWLSYGGTYDEQRFSRLTGIDTENVSELGVAWTYDLSTARGVESTPVVVDGVMYATSAWSVVHALDAVVASAGLRRRLPASKPEGRIWPLRDTRT